MKKVHLLLLLTSLAIVKEDILRRVDEIRAPAEDFSFDLEINVEEKDRKDVRKYRVMVKDATKTLVKFVYPPTEKGKVMLMVGNDIWMHFPTTQRSIRLSPQQRLSGDASNADVARVVYSYDYKVRSVSEGRLGDIEVYKLELTTKTKNAPYGRILLWVEKYTYKPLVAEHYSHFVKLLKKAHYENYKEILGKERPTQLRIHSELHKDRVTIMKYSNFKLEKFPESYFQKEYLKYMK